MQGLLQFWQDSDAIGRTVAALLLAMSVSAWVLIFWKGWVLLRARRDIDRAVPAMLRTADSMLVVFMSCILSAASSRTALVETLPTLILFGSFEPDPGFLLVARPAAFLRSTLAGGVFSTKVNERSE